MQYDLWKKKKSRVKTGKWEKVASVSTENYSIRFTKTNNSQISSKVIHQVD